MIDKNQSPFSEQETLLIETVLKLAAIEKILINKNICSKDELTQSMKQLSIEVIELMKAMKKE